MYPLRWLLAIVLTVSLAACQPVVAEAGSNDVIRVGVSVAETGNLAQLGILTRQGYEVWADWVNNDLGGFPVGNKTYTVELIVLDDQSDAALSAQNVDDLINVHKVDFMLGPYSSGITIAASQVSEDHKVVMVQPGGASATVHGRGFEYLFGVLTPAPNYTQSGLEAMSQAGATTAVIVVDDGAFAQSLADGAEQWAAQFGITVLARESYPAGSTDFTAQLTALKALNPDILVGGSRPADAVAMVQTAKAINWNLDGMLITNSTASASFIPTLGADAENVAGPTQWEPTINSAGPYFGTAADYAARFQALHGIPPTNHAASATAAGLALQLGIQDAGNLNKNQVADALRALDVPNTFYAPINFDATGSNAGKSMLTTQVQGGVIKSVAPAAVAEASLIYPKPPW